MAVAHHLTRLTNGTRETYAVHKVIQTALQRLQKGHARHFRTLLGNIEIASKLSLKYAVICLDLLLLHKLKSVL